MCVCVCVRACEQWVASVDMAANEEASENVIVKMSECFAEQAGQVG